MVVHHEVTKTPVSTELQLGRLDPLEAPKREDRASYKVLFLPGAQARDWVAGRDFQICVLKYVASLYADAPVRSECSEAVERNRAARKPADQLRERLKADIQTFYYPGLKGDLTAVVADFQSQGPSSYLAAQAQQYATELITSLGITSSNYRHFRFVGYSFGGLILHYLGIELAKIGVGDDDQKRSVDPNHPSFITFGDAACATGFASELKRGKGPFRGIRIASLDDEILFSDRAQSSGAPMGRDEYNLDGLVLPSLGRYRDLPGNQDRLIPHSSSDGHSPYLYLSPFIQAGSSCPAHETSELPPTKGAARSSHLLVGVLREMLVEPWTDPSYPGFLLEDLKSVTSANVMPRGERL